MSVRSAGNVSAARSALDLDGLSAWLRRRHPVKTAAAVAAETGLPEERIRKWLAAAVTHVPAWLDESVRAAELADLERERARLADEMERLRR